MQTVRMDEARVFDVQRGVNGERDRDRQHDGIEPASGGFSVSVMP